MHRLKICFVNPKPKSFVYDYPPLALGYLAAYLRKYGDNKYDFRIGDENAGHNILRILKDFDPDVVGITSTTPQIRRAEEIAGLVRRTSNKTLVIIGGVHPTIMPEKVLQGHEFDIACFGEGEETFKELIDSYVSGRYDLPFNRVRRIKGIAFKHNGRVFVNEPRDLIANLDSVPHYATELFDEKFYFLLPRPIIIGKTRRVGSMITSRGCPYNCVFCSNQGMWRGKVRFHSADYIIEEIEELVKKYNVGTIIFQDDLFMTNKRRIEETCKLLISSGFAKNLIWGCQGRANLIKERDFDLIKLMKKAGCVQLAFGFESGSERILDFLKGGSVSLTDNQKALDLTKRAGLRTMGYFMLGTQGETEEDLLRTKEFILRNQDKLDHFQMYITTPFPGTQLWDICKREGLVDDVDWEHYGVGILDKHVFSNTVSPEKVLQQYDDLTYLTMSKTSTREKVKWVLSNLRSNPTFAIGRIAFYLKKTFQ